MARPESIKPPGSTIEIRPETYRPEKPEAQLIYEVVAWLLRHGIQPQPPFCHYLSECFTRLATALDNSCKSPKDRRRKVTTYRAQYVPLPVAEAFHLKQDRSGPHQELKRDIWITYRFIQLRHKGISIESDKSDTKDSVCRIIDKEIEKKFKIILAPKGITSTAYRMMAEHPFFEEMVADLSGTSTDPPDPTIVHREYLLRRLAPYYAERPIPPHRDFLLRVRLISLPDDQYFPEDIANYCHVMASHIFRMGHTLERFYDHTIRVLEHLASSTSLYAEAFTSAHHKTVLKRLAQSDRDYAIALDVFDHLADDCQFMARNPADPAKAAATTLVGEKYGLDAKTVGKIYRKYQDAMEGAYWFRMKIEPETAWQTGTILYLLNNKEKFGYTPSNDEAFNLFLQLFTATDGSVSQPEVTQTRLADHLLRSSILLPETVTKLAAHTTAIIYASLARIEERSATQQHIAIDHLPKMTEDDLLSLSMIFVAPEQEPPSNNT